MSAVQPRRSSRHRTATTKANYKLLNDAHFTEDEEQGLDDGVGDGATQQRSSKRQKTKCSSTKKTFSMKLVGSRKRGRLSALPEMPLDILFEILQYLDPLDLLRMARTTKDLRSVLMNRSALSVWKSARANIPFLLDCPEGVSEPAFANFMFTTNCHVCLSPRAAYSFAARCVRYCRICIDHKVIWKPFSNFDLLGALPGGRAASFKLMYTYEVNRPNTPVARVWLQQDYDDLLKEYQEFPDSATKAEDFLELKKSTANDIGKREYEYRDWMEQQEALRSMQRYAARDKRRDAILDKLTTAGFGEDIRGMATWEIQQFRNHPMVKQPRLLSDRIWKNIEPVMVALMLMFRDQRKQRERAKIIARRRELFARMVNLYERDCPLGEVVPSAADLYFLDSAITMRQIIEESPDEEEITLEHFAEYKNQLPQLCSEWKTSMIPQLLSVIQRAPGEEVDESVLHLAKTIFACKLCDESIFYPEVLAHACLQEHPLFGPVDVSRRSALLDLETAPWNENHALTYIPRRVDSASEVIRGCGLKPDTAKTEDLDAKNFWAMSSTAYSGDVEVMDWRRAVKVSHIHPDDQWRELSKPESMRCFGDVELMFYLNSITIVACVHCRALLLSRDLIDHMSGHKVGPVERSDFFVHRDNPTICTFSISVDQCGAAKLS
ncbi:hypothetical protein CCMSSC00406_0003403 [Pleurotus cornucopiae]|uniref:Uncharacterized protein n=1 Tax=Pleurotus cornucopiae TaxID=5321 RepID=A0ACB7JA30_PLECO|nr:hypothetical protein CCMSSC00406_0003403 [Pleurotus cornucopiae]